MAMSDRRTMVVFVVCYTIGSVLGQVAYLLVSTYLF